MSQGEGLKKNIIKGFVRLFTSNRFVKKQLDTMLDKESTNAVKTLMKGKKGPIFGALPKQGLDHEKVVAIMDERSKGDINTYEGKTFAYVYQFSEAHNILTSKAFQMFVHTNVLNPMKFVSLKNMEVEVVAMTATMLGGDENFVGNVSSGGSESILLALKAYRDYHVKHHPGATYNPEVILCTTAHPAFQKGARMYNLELVYVEADSDWKMKVGDIKSKITSRTCCIITSAPQYAHGIVDPIEEISEIGYEANIPVHVDAAIGGYFLPWLEKLGQKFGKFDFRCRGVMSINADCHKFGFAPKGSSVIVFRKEEYRQCYFCTYSEWCGGLYISPTLLGTRNGGTIASAWASLVGIGEEGFMDVNKKMLIGAQYLIKTVGEIPELEIIGNPQALLVSFTTTKDSGVDIYHVADCLEDRGYHMERQQKPSSIHCTMMMQHYIYRENFAQDLKECVEVVKNNPQKYAGANGSAAMYGMVGSIPDGAIVEEFLYKFLGKIYSFIRDDETDDKNTIENGDKKNN